jgi:hypothetical protein
MRLLRRWFGDQNLIRTAPTNSFRPTLEGLEAREVPTVTSISSTFNGTAIPAGSTVWFSSVAKVSGVGSNPVTFHLTDATITSGNFTVDVPDAVITVSPSATTASTTFDATTNTWVTVVPRTGFSGNLFLSGAALPAPGGLPGGIKPVVWQADFTTDTPGVNINWQWAAAVYRTFGTDYNGLGVKVVDGGTADAYHNAHHAGTPENFTAFVFGGARGGGGSNFTGSYSATKSVSPSPTLTPPPADTSSLSGYVFFDEHGNGVNDGDPGIANVTITLQGTNDLGETVLLTTTTDEFGFYEFADLRPGTYSLQETQPRGWLQGQDFIGTQGGLVDSGNDLLYAIVLGSGVNGLHNDFGEIEDLPPQ